MEEFVTDMIEEVNEENVVDNGVLKVVGIGIATLIGAGIGAVLYFKNRKNRKQEQPIVEEVKTEAKCPDEVEVKVED